MEKKIYLLTIFLLNSITTFAQMPGWEWAIRAGGASGEVVPVDMVADAEGNTYSTGFYTNAYFGGVYYPSVGGSSDFFLAKYDPSGNVLWVKHSGGIHVEMGSAVCLDQQGNIYVTGSFESDSISFDGITIHNYSPWYYINFYDIIDIFTVKYTPSGEVLWVNRIGGIDMENSHAITVDSKENVYVIGHSASPSITLDSLTLNNIDDFVVKYDSTGDRVWLKAANEGGIYFGMPKTDSHDNLYLAGYFSGSTLEFDSIVLLNTQYPFNGITACVLKFDTGGNILSAKASSGGGYASCSGIILDDSDNVYISGVYGTNGSVIFDSITLPADKEMFIIKYNSSDSIEWITCDGSGSINVSKRMALDVDNNIYITGNYSSDSVTFGNTTLVNSDTWSDLYFLKYTNSGNFAGARGVKARVDFSYLTPSLASDNGGHIYFTGYFQSESLEFGATTLINYDTYQVTLFLAKMNDTLSCSAHFTLVPDTLLPHHYWGLNNATGAAPVTYSWSWGDGSYDTGALPDHIYANPGFYTICLTTTDATGCSADYCYSYDLQKMTADEAANTIIEVNFVDSIPSIPLSVQNINVLQSWSVFPNPASGNSFISYTLTGSATTTISLYDVLGNELQQLVNDGDEAGEHNLMFDTHKLANGIYFLQILAGDQTEQQKVVVFN